MKKIYIILFLAVSLGVQAQYENSSFTNTGRGCATTFATDYEALGINPANLGWNWKFSDKKFAMGFAEFGASITSDALTKSQLRSSVSAIIGGHSNNLTYEDKIGAASTFAQSGTTMNLDMSIFGFALTTKKAGGFAFRRPCAVIYSAWF